MGRRGFCWALVAATLSAAPQREAAEVRCSNTTDCTEAIQAALDDPTQRHVVLPAAGSGLPTSSGGETLWITRPLRLNRSDVVFELRPGVVLQARRGFFHGHSDTVLKVSKASNISIVGPGAAIRMWRVDYRNLSLYSKAEWRAGLSVYSGERVSISGLTIAETGGDGVYIEGLKTGSVTNVTTDGCYRNGMSIISAENLLVEDCTFANTGARGRWNGGETLTARTGGTAPRAGVE